MKNKVILLGLSFILIEQLFCQDKDTLIGKVIQISNPCLDDPCLPGLVYAIETDSVNYLIAIDDIWQWSENPLVINIDTFDLNDSIKAIGTISIKQDINFVNYHEIDIDTAFFLTALIENKFQIQNISIFPIPSSGIINIKSKEKQLVNVDIINIEGKLLFSSKYPNSESVYIENIKEKGIVILKLDFNNSKSITQKILLK